MIGRFSASLNPVVTGRTSAWRHSDMLERGVRPRHGAMAAIAGHRRGKVGGRLALGDGVVMAPSATARGDAVVRKEGRFPIGGPVATAAIGRCG